MCNECARPVTVYAALPVNQLLPTFHHNSPVYLDLGVA